MEHITLSYRQGSSDKLYQASLEPTDGGYAVQFSYGRRGSALQTGTKTSTPVAYDAARKIYDQLVAGKVAKGYQPGADGTPYQNTGKAAQATGIHCQLLNPIEHDQVERLLADPAYWMQEKWDSRRQLIRKQDDTITGINRLGLVVALPAPLGACVAQCPEDCILDGEAIGDMLCVFDALLNGDLKASLGNKRPSHDRQQLETHLLSHMRRLSKLPKHVGSYFQNQYVRYAP